MLFYTNMAIDAIQTGKTSWLKTFVTDEQVQAPLQHFVDAQTIFVKQVAKTCVDVMTLASTAMLTKAFATK